MALIILGDASSIGSLHNIIVPYKDQYRIGWGHGGVVIGNTIDNRLFSTGTVVLAGTNVTIGTSALGARQYLNLSVADPSAAANYISAGDYVLLSTAGAGTTVSVTGLQPAGPYLTAAADPYHDHGGIAHAIGNIGGTIGTYTTNSAPGTFCGWSLSIPNFLTTAAPSNHVHTNYAGLGATTGTTAGTDVKATLDGGGLSLRTPRFITTAAPVNHIHGVITTMSTTGSVMSYTSNSGGLTLGVPQWLTTLPGGGGGNNLTLAGNTSGTLTPFSAGTVTIAGGDNITLSQDGNAFTIIGAASGTNAGIAASLGTANTTGTKALISAGTLYIEGGDNITISQQNNTLRIIGGSVAPGTASNAVHAGNNITLSTQGVNTTISVVGLQPATNMSLYQQTSNMSLYQLTAQNTASLGTAYTSHTHSNLYAPLNYTSHTHSNLYIPLANTSRYAGTNGAITGGSLTLNTSGASINIQERSLRFIDSHGVSWGSAVNGYTTSVTASVEAGINSSLLGSIYFNDANGVTWGSATSGNSTTITASVNTVGGGAALQGSGTYTQNTGTIQFANSNGISFGLASNRMTASVANNAGNLYFSDGQGISFGVSTSGSSTTVTGSVIGGTMSGEYAGTVFSTSSVTGSNIRGSANTAGISLSVPNYVTRTGSLLFANNSGNITWSSSVNNNSTYVYGSAPVGSGSGTYDASHTHGNVSGINISATSASNGLTLSVPSYLTTAALSNHSHGNVSLALTNISATASSRSNGMTLSLSVPPVSGGGAALRGSGTYIQNTGTVQFANSNGITFGLTNNQMTASVGNNAGSMYFNDTNGVTFGVSSNTNNQSTITASIANYLTTAALSNHTHSQYLTTALATNYTSHTHNYAASNHTHGAYVQTVSYSTGTNFQFSSNSNTLILSVPRMISIALGGNTGGTTAFLSTGVVNLMGGNNITLNQVGQYVYIHGEDGGTGGGGTSIVPGSYLSSSLNGSTLSLSVTGLQPVGSYLSSNYTTHTHNYAATSHTHPYMGTGVSSSGNITVMGNTAGLSITAPVLGFLYFSNANGHSWSSSTSGVSTSIYICT